MPVAAICSVSDQEISYQWFTDEGTQRHIAILRWADILRVEVFKRDLFAYDLICLELRANDCTVEFDEEDPSWSDLTAALPLRLPGCVPWGEWFMAVAFPALEEKRQQIFVRTNSTSA